MSTERILLDVRNGRAILDMSAQPASSPVTTGGIDVVGSELQAAVIGERCLQTRGAAWQLHVEVGDLVIIAGGARLIKVADHHARGSEPGEVRRD